MAADLTTVLSVARTGSRVVRYLIRPARRVAGLNGSGLDVLNQFGRDPWLLGSERPSLTGKLQRGGHLVRRGAGLVVLLVFGVLGALLLLPLLLLLGFGAAGGSDMAGWLLGFTLLLGVLGSIWTARWASQLLRAEEVSISAAPGVSTNDELILLQTLRQHERALPGSARLAFHATVIATRDALRASAGETTLSRDVFDVRQAAREDLPELLDAYRSVPRTPRNDAEFTRQLALIEGRMQSFIRDQTAQQERALKASGRYLEGKYGQTDGQQEDRQEQ